MEVVLTFESNNFREISSKRSVLDLNDVCGGTSSSTAE